MSAYPVGSIWMHPNCWTLAVIVRGEVEFDGERYIVTSSYNVNREPSRRVDFNLEREMEYRSPVRVEGAALERLHANQREANTVAWVRVVES